MSEPRCPVCTSPWPGAETDAGTVAPGLGAAAARSILAALDETLGDVPRVLLREAESLAHGPVARVGTDQLPEMPRSDPDARYQLFGEIARGGMGAVLRGRDADLGRELAIKVLLSSHKQKPELVRRFVEEAQISGQLQHPGVIPVYELGTFADKRPYFTMKLVKGKTLSALLADRRDPGQDLPHLLSVFEQVCQTMAYAHARGVIHRDLKPSNVMVGSFGEVQVMDWGLAKVLAAGGAADDRRTASRPAETIIQTLRSGSSVDESVAGSLMGTPAYISPEQARGDVDALDTRADVFGLGAILCEVLTGSPPYTGRSAPEVLRRAARGDLSQARERLDACGADGALVALARQCLSPEPADRPRDAGTVSARMTEYLQGVQERLRNAELAKVHAQEKAARLKYIVTAAASLLLLVVGGGTTAYVLDRQARARNARFEQTLALAEQLESRIGQASRERAVSPSEWNEVAAAVQSAADLMPDSAPAALRARAVTLRETVRARRETAEADRKLLAALAEARFSLQDLGGVGMDTASVAALAEAGLDVDRLSLEESAQRVQRRPPPVALELAGYLDGLASVRRALGRPIEQWRHLLQTAKAADPDPYRTQLRERLEAQDLKSALPELRALAADSHAATLAPASTLLLASALRRAEDEMAYLDLLKRSADVHANDLWVNFSLAEALAKAPGGREHEALRYYSAARAIRPDTAHDMGHLLQKMGRKDEGLAVFEDLARRVPGNARHAGCLGVALKEQGRTDEAKLALGRAAELARRRIADNPDEQQAYYTLGFVLNHANDQVGVTAAYVAALRRLRRGDQSDIYDNLVIALSKFDDPDAKVAGLVEAIRLRPVYTNGPRAMIDALEKQGRLAGALEFVRESFGDEPRFAPVYRNIGWALRNKERLDDAIAAHREALRLDPADYRAHSGLGNVLVAKGEHQAAEAEFRKSIRIKADDGYVHAGLGDVLVRQGKASEGLEALLRAAELGYDERWMQDRLVNAVLASDASSEVAARVRAAAGPKPGTQSLHRRIGDRLRNKGLLDDAIAAYRDALRAAPGDAHSHAQLAMALGARGDNDGAAAARREAFRLQPEALGSERLLIELARQGPWLNDPALDLLLDPDRAEPRLEHIRAVLHLVLAGDVGNYRRTCARLLANHSNTNLHVPRALALHPEPQIDVARLVSLAEATAASGVPWSLYTLGLAQYRAGRYEDAVKRLTSAITGSWAASPLNYPVLAMACHRLGRSAEAQRWLDMSERWTIETDNAWWDAIEMSLLLREARALILGTAAPAQLDLFSVRKTAVFRHALGRGEAPAAVLREAIRLRPLDASLHMDLGLELSARGDADGAAAAFREADRCAGDDMPLLIVLRHQYVSAGRWEQAARAYGRVVAMNPLDHGSWYVLSPVLLAAGDVEGYRRHSREMLDRFESDPRPEVAERTSKACLLSPSPGVDLARALKLAERAVTDTERHQYYWYFMLTRGLAELRDGRDVEALSWLDRMGPRQDAAQFEGLAFCIRALACKRLGRDDDARAALAAARERMAQRPDPSRGRPYVVSTFNDWLIFEALFREAEAAVGANPAVPDATRSSNCS